MARRFDQCQPVLAGRGKDRRRVIRTSDGSGTIASENLIV